MKNIKYGIVSTASIVPRFINAVKEVGEGELTAIASRDINKSQKFADEYGIKKAYGSYEELFEDEEVNVVYIATVNSEHYNISLQALESGKNVICEKPFTLKKSQAEHLFDVAKEKDLFLIEAQKSVFLPVSNKVKEMINDGVIGDVRMLDFSSSSLPTYNTWINSKELGGGTLYGNASYFLELSQHLFDKKFTEFEGLSVISSDGADSQCVLSFKLGENILVSSKISYDILTVNKAMIYGTLGYIEIPDYWKARKARVVLRDGETIDIDYPCEHELIYEVKHIEDCLKKGLKESPVMNREMTVDTIEILETISGEWY